MKITAINQHLDELEQALQHVGLWSDTPPTTQQLSSQEPFCVDTMPFEQWLQWLFAPRLRELIKQPTFTGLPHRSDIHSMAAYVFQQYDQDTDHIVEIIKCLDSAINGD